MTFTDKDLTGQDIKEEIGPDEREFYLNEFQNDPVIPLYMKMDKDSQETYIAGAWLEAQLIEHCCDPYTMDSICFAHGQRSVMMDPYEAAARAYNKFVDGTPEYGGPELSRKIIEVMSQKYEG